MAPDAEVLRGDCWRETMAGERRCCHYPKVELKTDENCSNPDQTEG